MPRKKSAATPKAVFRRTPAWCAAMTALVEQVAALIQEQHLYFTHKLYFGEELNTAGIVQGVLLQTAAGAASVTTVQWNRYLEQFAAFEFTGEVKGIHFEPQAVAAISTIGQALETATDANIKWGEGYRYHLIIAVSLLWFVDMHRKT